MVANLTFLEVSSQDFWQEVQPHYERIYSNRQNNNPNFHYNDSEKAKLGLLASGLTNMMSLFVLAKLGDKLVGWHFGGQTSMDAYYMKNSAVLEDHRGHGFYEKILLHVMGVIVEKGFQIIYGRHHVNNPAVLIPKIRNGFVITSTEMDDQFGFLITLKYFVNEQRRFAFGKISGLTR